jgi:large subunit ribosomal protein L25
VAEERLRVERRTLLGKKVSQLRRRGVLPAVIFGQGDSVPVQTDAHQFALGYRKWGHTTLITIEGVDGDIPALVDGVSRDPRTGRLLHADFMRVSLTEKVNAEVPLQFVGESGAVKNLSAVLLHALAQIEVEAFPQDIPHRIEVDLSPLETMEDEIHVRDLVVDSSKVRIINEPDELVVKVVPQRAEEEIPAPAVEVAAEAPAEGEAAEPVEGEPPAAPPAAGTAQSQKQPTPQPKK